MTTITFNTIIREDGNIQVPDFEGIVNKNVEVTLTIQQKEIEKTPSINDFLEKWSGAFSVQKSDDKRYNYLLEKYK